MKEKLIDWLSKYPRTSHTIRTLAGAYLIYMCYSMFTDPSANKKFLVILCGIIFAVVGVFFAVTSVYALNKGYCSDYMKSYDSTEEEEEEYGERDTQGNSDDSI